MNRLHFIDNTSFVLDGHTAIKAKDFVDNVLSASGDEKIFLETRTRATHSGQLMQGRCYTGWGMKAGVQTWYDSKSGGRSAFNKPIITNHDMTQAPIGRVVYAEYVQIKDGKDWDEDWRNPDTGLNHGSGYIITTGRVFDRDAIEKIMDGRYNTVSTRQIADTAWCSVCGSQFDDFGPSCEHEIGEEYEAEDGNSLMYAVTGKQTYIEQSYVNSPRQENAVTLSFKKIRQIMQDSKDSQEPIIASYSFCDSKFPILGLSLKNEKEAKVDLCDSNLPSTDIFTGRKIIAMKNTILKGFDAARKKALMELEDNSSNPEADNKPEAKKDEKPDATFQEKFIYRMKDKFVLNLSDIIGKDKTHYKFTLVKDSTSGHKIVESYENNGDIADEENTYVTLICESSLVKSALESMEARENKDTLVSGDKTLKDAFDYKEEYLPDILSFVGRMNSDGRAETISMLLDAGLIKKPELKEEEDMSKIAELQQQLKELEKKYTDASSLADSREADRKKLLDDLVDAKAANMSFKASLIIDSEARLQGVTLTDENREEKVENLIKEFGSSDALDKMVEEKVLNKLSAPKKTKDLLDAGLSPSGDVDNKNHFKPRGEGKKSRLNLSDLTQRSEKIFGNGK